MNLKFDFPAPIGSDLGTSRVLWATYYNVHRAAPTQGGIPLRDMSDNVVGPELSERDWCFAAMEGTVEVGGKVYNYEGKSTPQASCKLYFPNLAPAKLKATESVRFRMAKGPYGDGAKNYKLVPYRTIAVDRNEIPLGTAVYIADARGTSITLPDGTTATHDGYFFAADVGGLIKGNHIDVFIGVAEKNPFAFVGSKPSKTFTANDIVNQSIQNALAAMHA